jgi:hypothetical protein
MSYSNLIDSNLNKAFLLLKDLAKPMTFTKVIAADFDFTTGVVDEELAVPIVIKVVSIEDKKPNKASKTITKTILAKSKELPDLDLYDQVSFEGYAWKVGNIIKQAGRIWMFEIVREG